MVAVFAVVLALAGAPTNTPVLCLASLPGAYGQTPWGQDGPARIELRSRICLGARYAGSNRKERERIAAEHPQSFMAQLVGVGLLVSLHEAEHVALRSADECLVQKAALEKLPTLLKQFMPLQWRSALSFARDYDRELPASYRGC